MRLCNRRTLIERSDCDTVYVVVFQLDILHDAVHRKQGSFGSQIR